METLQKRRIDRFEVVLEHDIDEQYQYVPGEMMKGVIVLNCTEEITINQLSVTLKGEGNVIWEVDSGKKKDSGTFKSRELYLERTEDLIVHTGHMSAEILKPEEGPYEFPFYIELPDSLPSSYIGRYGGVTYIIKAHLKPDRKYGSDAATISEPFLVLRRYDLALEPSKLQPYEESRRRRYGCLGGQIEAFVKLNRTGFIPGEDIKIQAEVTNGSKLEVTGMQAAFVMRSKFCANTKEIYTETMVHKHEDKYSLDSGDGRRWNDVRLNIPPYIPESYLEGCDIIDVNYELVFIVEVNYNIKDRRNVRISIPITIATHGIKPDDDIAEEPELRPLYVRQTDYDRQLPEALQPADDFDELDDIDPTLFEQGPNNNVDAKRQNSVPSHGPQNNASQLAQEALNANNKKNVMAAFYNGIVDEIPDQPAQINNRGGSQRKKKQAPAAPPEIDEQTQL